MDQFRTLLETKLSKVSANTSLKPASSKLILKLLQCFVLKLLWANNKIKRSFHLLFFFLWLIKDTAIQQKFETYSFIHLPSSWAMSETHKCFSTASISSVAPQTNGWLSWYMTIESIQWVWALDLRVFSHHLLKWRAGRMLSARLQGILISVKNILWTSSNHFVFSLGKRWNGVMKQEFSLVFGKYVKTGPYDRWYPGKSD